jgi:hypothetical protein
MIGRCSVGLIGVWVSLIEGGRVLVNTQVYMYQHICISIYTHTCISICAYLFSDRLTPSVTYIHSMFIHTQHVHTYTACLYISVNTCTYTCFSVPVEGQTDALGHIHT